ncbi:MAG: YncE family protein [Flavobacteriaceae bacterium]|nr:YncE family protein [Flavobacteriaceae bacterium]
MKLLKRITYVLIATLILTSCSSDDDVVTLPTCEDVIDGTVDICVLLTENPDNSLGLEDCDGDGINNLTECENGTDPTDSFLGDFQNGLFVTNEGPFGTGTGTVSFISEDYSYVEQAIFNNVNETDLGNVVQSMGFNDGKAYIVINNSHKIEVVNRYTFESIATISDGLDNPRFFVSEGNFGYVSNWGDPGDNSDDFIAIIDLITNEVIETISVDFGPENVLISRGKLYVAHKGGWGQNNIISVFNTETNTFLTTITVGDVPNSMVILSGSLWVLCGGNPEFTGNETNGELVEIDVDSDTVSQTFNFETTEHPSGLTMDDVNLIYSLNGAVYSKEASSTELPSASIISGFFYSMTANDGKLFATDAADFNSNGTLKIFDLTTNLEIESIEVGIIPGGVYFNN